MPSVSASVVIPAKPEVVWAVVADVANAQRWNKAWNQIELTTSLSEGRGTRFRAHTSFDDGESTAFEFEVTEWIAPEYIVFTPLRDPEEEQYQITLDWHAFRLVPVDGENTRVELTARATARGFRGRIAVFLLCPGHHKAALEEVLQSPAGVFGVHLHHDPV